MDRALLLETAAADAAALCKDMRECVVLARGFNQATALEASLKLVETCYVGARAYSGADFLHGPIAQMEEGLTCLLFAPSGDTLESMLSLAQRLGGISEKIVCFSDNSELLSIGHAGLLAPTVPEWLSPLVYIIPAQLFACRLALKRGLNPDTPRGLNKVTMTV
jgi:glucosamine--fructose-6-phosphate aminotransferase (isomerizing)